MRDWSVSWCRSCPLDRAWLLRLQSMHGLRCILKHRVSRAPVYAPCARYVVDRWTIVDAICSLTTFLSVFRFTSLMVRISLWRVRTEVACCNKAWSVANLLKPQYEPVIFRMESSSFSTRISLSVYFTYTQLRLKAIVHKFSAFWLAIIFDYCMLCGLSEVFLFFKDVRDAKETAVDLLIKCFMHHMKSPPWIPFESKVCLKAARKFKIEMGSIWAALYHFLRWIQWVAI